MAAKAKKKVEEAKEVKPEIPAEKPAETPAAEVMFSEPPPKEEPKEVLAEISKRDKAEARADEVDNAKRLIKELAAEQRSKIPANRWEEFLADAESAYLPLLIQVRACELCSFRAPAIRFIKGEAALYNLGKAVGLDKPLQGIICYRQAAEARDIKLFPLVYWEEDEKRNISKLSGTLVRDIRADLEYKVGGLVQGNIQALAEKYGIKAKVADQQQRGKFKLRCVDCGCDVYLDFEPKHPRCRPHQKEWEAKHPRDNRR